MIRSPTVRDDGSGNPTLVKHAIGDGCHRLRHEAEILVAARGANVVEVVGFDAHENRCELSLRYLEAATLAEHPALDLAELLRVLAQVGTAIAELHRRGICHGALNRDHILVEPHGSPVLCGFGEATGPEDLQQYPSGSDLTALASLAEVELTRTEQLVVSGIERRHCGEARAACRDLADTAVAAPDDSQALGAWLVCIEAVRASVVRERQSPLGDSGRELSALPAVVGGQRDLRELLGFGASMAEAGGIPRSPARPTAATGGGERDRRRLAAAAALAAVVLVVAFIGWQMLASEGLHESPDVVAAIGGTLRDTSATALVSPQPPRPVAAAPTVTPSASEGAQSTPASSFDAAALSQVSGRATLIYGTSRADCANAVPESTDAGALDAEPDVGPSSASHDFGFAHKDVDGDGCPDKVSIEQAVADRRSSTITTPFGRWRLGTTGDLIAVGDWNCDGRSTLALVRPRSGLAAFYESWPRSARSVVPARIVTVPLLATAVSTAAAADEPLLDGDESTTSTALNAAGVIATGCDKLVIRYDDAVIEVAPRDLDHDNGLDLTSDAG
ncbi:lipopolysaccharide kinase InaA family protein [Candidatus Poriferisodalis sp.]|uniref:lipopolysaccharide kinase InaA family protein n=1 Tax=Candidatus Poriferisodalis sp. TaxID=3101277 RepID=UPI003D0B9526